MPNYNAEVPGLYPLGQGQNVALPDLSSITSNVLNTRDLGQPGASDFVLLGPGSQVWYLGYAIRATALVGAPTNPLGFLLSVGGSFELAAPFFFGQDQHLLLPLYLSEVAYHYSGRVRIEDPAAILNVSNQTGVELDVSFQFWGKAS